MLALDSYAYIWQYRWGAWAPLYTAGKQPWAHVAEDQDGSIIGVVVEGGPSYFSDNFGETWEEEISAGDDGNWSGIDLTNDGTIGTACEYGGYVWLISAPGLSWLVERGTGLGDDERLSTHLRF
jgi:hypothetical protein